MLINAINLANVKAFGETEFWFAIIKVAAIIGMILLGIYLLVGGGGGPQASVSNLWDRGGFFPNGLSGLVMTLAIIMFSFGGLELVGITAAEASEPRKVIPKAINQVIYRILIFYIGALAVLLSLYPWDQLVETINASGDDYSGSPFVQIFSLIGSGTAANILNFVVLTAALSVYNSGVYCNSRMLYGLAAQGDAPKVLMSVDRRGVPVLSILVSALITFLCVIVNYVLPHKALELLMSLVVAALVINWAMISLSHEVPRGDEAAGRGHLLQGTLVAVQQLPVPGLRGVHPWHHADDPRDQHLGVRHPILAAADVVVLPGQAVAGGKARARPAGLSLRVARTGASAPVFISHGQVFLSFSVTRFKARCAAWVAPGRWLFIIPELPCGAIHQSCQFSTLCAMMVIF